MATHKSDVGGVPIFYCTTYTDPGTTAVTITTPAGFYPDYVLVLMNENTNPDKAEWYKGGNATPGGVFTDGTTGIMTLMTTNGINVGTAVITLGTDVVNDNITGTVCAWRYTQG